MGFENAQQTDNSCMLYIGTPKNRTFEVSKFRMFGTIRLLNEKINPVTVAFTLHCLFVSAVDATLF